jgi:hypothetical protein
MGSRSGTSQTETRIDPRLVPFVEQGLSGAQNLFQTGQLQYKDPTTGEMRAGYVPEYFSGQTFVGPSDYTQQAMQMAAQRAQAGSPLVQGAQGAVGAATGFQAPAGSMFGNIYGQAGKGPAAGMYQDIYGRAGQTQQDQTAGGAFLGMNPFLQATFEAASRPITSQFQQQIQNINSQASRAGRFGSAAQGQLQAGAAESLAANLSGLGERLGFAGYQQERQLQEAALNRQQQAQQQALINQLAATSGLGQTQAQQFATQLQAAQGLTGAEQGAANVRLAASQLAPGMAAQDYADIQRLLQVGQMGEQYQQQELQDQLNRFNFQQQAPFRALQQYLSFIGGVPAGQQQVAPEYTNPAATALGGAALVSAFNQPRQNLGMTAQQGA